MKFSIDFEPDDFETALSDKSIQFVMTDESANDFVEHCINENTYDVANTIEEEFEELKTTANYNYLNQNVPQNGNNKKRKKL